MSEKTSTQKVAQLSEFNKTLEKYETAITKLLGKKYGITPEEFMIKVVNAVKKNKELLNCSPASLFGSIMYFAEIGLPFNTPEGFGFILPYRNKGNTEATPIIGYKGLIEIAYRNPKLKSFRIQAVYENDNFDYQYGTNEYITHKPTHNQRGKLKCVYAIAQLVGTDAMFCVVHEDELKKIQNLSKSGGSSYSPYNNGTDVFNIMQSKVAAKLLFKMLPKSQNETLSKVLEMDNRFDYEKNVKIKTNTTNTGYEIVEEQSEKKSVMKEQNMPSIDIIQTEAHAKLTEK